MIRPNARGWLPDQPWTRISRVSSPGREAFPGVEGEGELPGPAARGKAGGEGQGQAHGGIAGRPHGDGGRRLGERLRHGHGARGGGDAGQRDRHLAGIPLAAEGEGELRAAVGADRGDRRGTLDEADRAEQVLGLATDFRGAHVVGQLPEDRLELAGEVENRGPGAEAQELDLPALLLDGLGVREELVVERAVPGIVLAGRRRLLDAVSDEQHVLETVVALALLNLRPQGVESVADVGESTVTGESSHDPLDGGPVSLGGYHLGNDDFSLPVERNHLEEVAEDELGVDQLRGGVGLDRVDLLDPVDAPVHGEGSVENHEHVDVFRALVGGCRRRDGKEERQDDHGGLPESHGRPPGGAILLLVECTRIG